MTRLVVVVVVVVILVVVVVVVVVVVIVVVVVDTAFKKGSIGRSVCYIACAATYSCTAYCCPLMPAS